MIHHPRKAGAGSPETRHRWLGALLLLTIAAAQLPAAEIRLLHADQATLRSDSLAADAGTRTLRMQIAADGRVHQLGLRPNELLTPTAAMNPQAQAYQGDVGRFVGSWAALTRIGARWSGIWYDGAEYFGVDSAGSLATASPDAAALPADSLVVFRLRDVSWDEFTLENDTQAVPGDGAQLVQGIAMLAENFPFPDTMRRLDVALVADAQLAERDGPATEANLLARLNIIDGLFSNQLGVRIAAHSITTFSTGESEPFGATTNGDTLLEELSAWRAADRRQREAGLTHLFTGRNLNGRTVGMAYMKSLCSRRYSSSLSQATSSISFAALIAAHELAHVFGAPHDGDATGACAVTPTDYLMSPRINGSQTFSPCSLEQMAPQLASASCLAPQNASRPNDPTVPIAQGGGGGALPIWVMALLGLLVAARSRRRGTQMPANQLRR